MDADWLRDAWHNDMNVTGIVFAGDLWEVSGWRVSEEDPVLVVDLPGPGSYGLVIDCDAVQAVQFSRYGS